MLTSAFLYKRWADRQAVTAIRKVDHTICEAQVSFLLQQLNHMIIVGEIFKNRLLEEEAIHNSKNTETVPYLDDLEKRFEMSNEWYLDYASKAKNAETLDQKVHFQFVDGKGGNSLSRRYCFIYSIMVHIIEERLDASLICARFHILLMHIRYFFMSLRLVGVNTRKSMHSAK